MTTPTTPCHACEKMRAVLEVYVKTEFEAAPYSASPLRLNCAFEVAEKLYSIRDLGLREAIDAARKNE